MNLPSDGVLNPSGVRFGSSEIYNVLARPWFRAMIEDSIVVGQQRINAPHSDPAERVVLFVKCYPRYRNGVFRLNPQLEASIRKQIAEDLSRRHVPAYIFGTGEIPYNANGKKIEIPLKAVLCGGKKALQKLKLAKEEFEILQWYEKILRD